MAGPLLGVLGGRAFVPVVIGELVAGVIVGQTGLEALDPTDPPGSGLIAAAQLGVPAAVIQIGLDQQVITAAEGAAIMVAALASLVACAVGASLLGRGHS